MKKNSKYYFLVAIIVIIAVAVFVFLRFVKKNDSFEVKKTIVFDGKTFLNLNDTVGYVGIERCRTCHYDEYKNYIKSGMGMSYGLANRKKSASVFQKGKALYDEKSDFYYQPFWDGKEMKVLEFRLKEGDTIYKRIEKVDYIVGSGQHTNSHIMNVGGYLFQVPFTFYTQQGVLDFPPGFEDGNNSRFSRKVGFECMSCHNAYPTAVDGSINKYKEVPLGINCERCHGPGELHSIAWEDGILTDSNAADYTIVMPTRLSVDLQFQICLRCHSQGNSVLKEGKSFLDFKPGMYVTEVLDVFREVYENDEDAFWMETHPERLMKSKCFIESHKNPKYKPLTCIDCHFTAGMQHISFDQTPIDTFVAKCMICHNNENNNLCSESKDVRKKNNNNCIECHMVRTGTFDIPHVIISDHFIRVTDKWKEPIKSTSEIKTGDFISLKCMTNNNPDNKTMAWAYIHHFEKFLTSKAVIDSAYKYLKDIPLRNNLKIWIYYYFQKKDYNKIVNIAEKYFVEKEKDAMTNYQTGQAYHHLKNYKRALFYYKLAVKLQPYNLEFRNKYGAELIKLRKFSKAMQEFEFILNEYPNSAIANNNLGFLYLFNKDFKNAKLYLKKSLQLDPDYVNAHLNMVKLYLGKGEIEVANNYLKKLNRKFPNNKEVKELEEVILGH